MNVIILIDDPFPIGMAATNRVISNAKGFLENGAGVDVLCLNPYEIEGRTIVNKDASGEFCGIRYKYPAGTTRWPKKKIDKIIITAKSLINTVRELVSIKSKKYIDAIILCSNNPIHILLFFFTSAILGINYFQEKSEFPFVLRRTDLPGKIYAWLYTTYIYKVFDGMFVMTSPLKEYFEKRIRTNARLVVIPMTVEKDRFVSCGDSRPFPFKYIGYCGYMGGNKDGVDILIRAFAIISRKFAEINLVLIGYAKDEELRYLKQLASESGLENRVIFTGKIERDRIPSYLCNAEILALARPTSLQAAGGFPSKLGEYLATGKPVVVTKVGEIPVYLSDGETAFLAEPDSAELFAEKLEYVLSNYEKAEQTGKRGSDLVKTYFNYRHQSKRMLDFIESFKNGKG